MEHLCDPRAANLRWSTAQIPLSPPVFLHMTGSCRCWDPTFGGSSHFGTVKQSHSLLDFPFHLLVKFWQLWEDGCVSRRQEMTGL